MNKKILLSLLFTFLIVCSGVVYGNNACDLANDDELFQMVEGMEAYSYDRALSLRFDKWGHQAIINVDSDDARIIDGIIRRKHNPDVDFHAVTLEVGYWDFVISQHDDLIIIGPGTKGGGDFLNNMEFGGHPMASVYGEGFHGLDAARYNEKIRAPIKAGGAFIYEPTDMITYYSDLTGHYANTASKAELERLRRAVQNKFPAKLKKLGVSTDQLKYLSHDRFLEEALKSPYVKFGW